jgi:hypothetical protein
MNHPTPSRAVETPVKIQDFDPEIGCATIDETHLPPHTHALLSSLNPPLKSSRSAEILRSLFGSLTPLIR